MGTFEGIVSKMFVAGIVIVSLFSFIITLQVQNNAVDPLSNDPLFNNSFAELEEQIAQGTADAEDQYGVFNSEEPKAGFGSIVLFGIVSAGKTFSSIVFGVLGAILQMPLVVFGIPATVYNQILAWLIISVLVGLWILYKLGG